MGLLLPNFARKKKNVPDQISNTYSDMAQTKRSWFLYKGWSKNPWARKTNFNERAIEVCERV